MQPACYTNPGKRRYRNGAVMTIFITGQRPGVAVQTMLAIGGCLISAIWTEPINLTSTISQASAIILCKKDQWKATAKTYQAYQEKSQLILRISFGVTPDSTFIRVFWPAPVWLFWPLERLYRLPSAPASAFRASFPRWVFLHPCARPGYKHLWMDNR